MKNIYISIQTLYSVLCWSNFGSDYSLESWVWCYKLGTPVFGEFLFSADPLKLCQVWLGALLHGNFQISPEIFDQVQVRALDRRLKDFQRLVPKPLLRCLGCVLRIVVLLEGEPSPQSELWSRFSSRISLLCSVNFSLKPDYSPCPCCW